MKHDIFISYSRRDLDIVRVVYERLVAEGFNVWIDMKGLLSGDQFKREITKAIINARVLVFFSSEQSNRSIWTASEIGVAREFKIPILPVRIDNTPYSEEILLDLVNLNYTDYTVESQRPGKLDEFIASLKRNYPPQAQAETPAPTPAPTAAPTPVQKLAETPVITEPTPSPSVSPQALTEEFEEAYRIVCARYPILSRPVRRSEDIPVCVNDICRCIAIGLPARFPQMNLADQIGLLEAYDRDDQVRLALATYLELVQAGVIR